MRGVTLLGSTGTIGVNTLDVIARHRNAFRVVALAAHRNVETLLTQCATFHPEAVALLDENVAEQAREKLKKIDTAIRVFAGKEGLEAVARLKESDTVMAGIVGSAGLAPTLAAVSEGKRILLANKESLVMTGKLFMEAAKKYGAEVLPVDSEHNAIFQCLAGAGNEKKYLKRIILTASGGPFRKMPLTQLEAVTPEMACAHPIWRMGKKISIDSATMMNKGLEIIEAQWLFGVSHDSIEVMLHPQSMIHSLVEFTDGSLLAQLGFPDMRIPIAYALAWPSRIESGVAGLNLMEVGQLDFSHLEESRYPCLTLAYAAIKKGGTATAILNAANEVAVQAFMEGKIKYTDIPRHIEHVLGTITPREATSLEIVLADDARARRCAEEACLPA